MTDASLPTAAAGVRFVLDDTIVDAAHADPATTLLTYLREHLGRTGTKEGCAEGDCGACTVLVGELAGERIDYKAVNACIRFLPTLDGKQVVTVESLKGSRGVLHPVQQALVDHHASQCGFCTPGFVMSLAGLYLQEAPGDETVPLERERVVDALSGNLCRCTGYRPIIDAGCSMNSYPTPERWSRADAQSAARRERLRSIARSESLRIGDPPSFVSPRSLDELASLFASAPQSLLLAGGTDVGLWVTKQLRELPPVLYLGEVAELRQVCEHDGELEIGAAVTLAEGYDALVSHYPMLAELANRFASVPIRNSGTLCGNLANGSPIGDSMPVLIALGASVGLRKAERLRRLPLEDLYLGYQKHALEAGEFIVDVRVPLPQEGREVASYKISKRFDQDISAVCAGFAVQLEHGRVISARLAFGGMAATPKRAPAAERALTGAAWSMGAIEQAAAAIGHDFAPISDMRASRGYRLQIAGALLRRFFLEHSGARSPCRLSMSVDRALST